MKTYKYLGKISSECFFKDLTLRFCQPIAFNDPFELQPEFHITNEDRFEDNFKCNFSLSPHTSYIENYEITNRTAEAQVPKVDSKTILSQVSESIGILCLTQAETLLPANLLMWAHYSESHQGCSIELKTESDFVNSANGVHYRSRRPIIDSKIFFENETVSISDLYFKSIEWSYENEIRITKNLSDCIALEHTDQLGHRIFVSKVPIEVIECVYVGCNASPKLKEAAIQFHKDTGIKVKFLSIHDEEYKLIPHAAFGDSYSESLEVNRKLIFERETI